MPESERGDTLETLREDLRQGCGKKAGGRKQQEKKSVSDGTGR